MKKITKIAQKNNLSKKQISFLTLEEILRLNLNEIHRDLIVSNILLALLCITKKNVLVFLCLHDFYNYFFSTNNQSISKKESQSEYYYFLPDVSPNIGSVPRPRRFLAP